MSDAGADPSAADLFVRAKLPDEVALLLARYPRAVWPAHPNLGDTARFWLQRHAMFRGLGGTLAATGALLREGPADARTARALFGQLDRYLGELHGHHMVEDRHYFPLFRVADARLGRGFDILDADHHVLDGLIHEIVGAANGYGGELSAGADASQSADRLATTLARTLAGVARHLDDEEDIVMPLILERGEGPLGIG